MTTVSSMMTTTTTTIAAVHDPTLPVQVNFERIVLQEDVLYRVMRNDRSLNGVDIIVPHFGYCIGPHESVDHFEPISAPATDSSEPTGYSDSITSLIVYDSSHVTLLPLIEYLGPKLLSLSTDTDAVHYDWRGIKCAFLRRTLRAWPQLKGSRFLV